MNRIFRSLYIPAMFKVWREVLLERHPARILRPLSHPALPCTRNDARLEGAFGAVKVDVVSPAQ